MSFADVRDQPVAIRLLRNMLRLGRVPNGLLFWGPGGVGKRLAALEFAKSLNCTGAKFDACGTCLSCRRIAHGNHPDIHTVAPVRKSRTIDVEAIGAIIELASLRPYESRCRVFVIHDADRMRGPAQNHLLKTLEEPLGHSVFMLLSESPQLLLPTIRSRCQRLRFGALRPDTVTEILMAQRDIDETRARAIAALSQGQMTRAFGLVDTGKREAVLDVIRRLDAGEDPLALAGEFTEYLASQRERIESSMKLELDADERRELSKEDRERMKDEQSALIDAMVRRDILEHLYLFETWYRDVLVCSSAGGARYALNRDLEGEIPDAPPEGAGARIESIEKARVYLERFLGEDRVFRDLFFALAP